jgi:hypothetical protein
MVTAREDDRESMIVAVALAAASSTIEIYDATRVEYL